MIDVNARIGQDETDFRRLEKIVDGNGDGAGLQNAEKGRHKFRAVFEPEADAISRAHAEFRTQLARHPKRLRPEVSVGKLRAAPKQRGLVRVDVARTLPGRGPNSCPQNAGCRDKNSRFKVGRVYHIVRGLVIDSDGKLTEFLPALRAADWLALDTEADSLHAYPEKLCLIQLSTTQGDRLIDPLARVDLQPLWLELKKHQLILHGADYDLRLLRKNHGFVPNRIFDTMLASRLLGEREFGLGNLVKKYLGVVLEKGSQKADWSKRPLTPRMEDYARHDTRHLKALSDILRAQLRAEAAPGLAGAIVRSAHRRMRHPRCARTGPGVAHQGQPQAGPRRAGGFARDLALAREGGGRGQQTALLCAQP